MKKIPLYIESLTSSKSKNVAYALILKEHEGNRKLPIVIGSFEAQSIAIAIDADMMTPRPLTHDLMMTILDLHLIQVQEVVIYDYKDNIFFSKLVLNNNGRQIEVDSRTSDAVALAVRAKVAIYTFEHILSDVNAILSEDEEQAELEIKKDLPKQVDDKLNELVKFLADADFEELGEQESDEKQNDATFLNIDLDEHQYDQFSIEELESFKTIALENEDYEKAAELRDYIENKKKK
ncbi:MAG: bifunctional nuclease domain-containing protein [Flavobacteriales bacterium]